MATASVTAGSYTHYLDVTQVSQNIGANTSVVRFRYWTRRNTSAAFGSWNFDGKLFRVWDSVGGNTQANRTFDFRAQQDYVWHDFTRTISHDANGYRTVSFSLYFEGHTANMPAASASSSITLTRIPKPPLAPGTPNIGTVTPSTVALTWSAPDNRGSAITSYTVQYATNSAFTTGVGTQTFTGTSGTVTGLAPGGTYYFRVKATNARGDSPYSPSASTSVGLPAPTLNSWGQNATDGLVASWSPPPVATGLTGYRLQIATNDTFTSGVRNFDLGNVLTHTVTGLAGGRRYWARVAARTAGGVNTYSAPRETLLVLAAGDLDGWSRVGSKPSNIAYYTVEGIRRGVIGSRQGLWLESLSTAAVNLPADTFGIAKTVTDLTVGKAYRFQARATIDGSPLATNYRLDVVDEESGDSVNVATNTDLGYIEFVADASSVVLRIMLTEDVDVPGAVEAVERVAFHDIKLLELGTDYPVRLRETVYESNLANHFDLACNSVGATWYVAPDGVTRFRLPGTALPVTATFTDEPSADALHYVDIDAAYDTRGMFNRLDVTNYGVDDERQNEDNDELVRTSDTSVSAYGVRSVRLETNLWDEVPYDETLENRLSALLAENDEPRLLVSSLRWNAQENLEMASVLDVGQRVTVRFNGTTQDSQIVALQHDITPTRWMVNVTLRKVGA